MRYLIIVTLVTIGCAGPEIRPLEDTDVDADIDIPDVEIEDTNPMDVEVEEDTDIIFDTDLEETIDADEDIDVVEDADVLIDADPESPCEEGLELCNEVCIDLQSNVDNCGSCGNQCTIGRQRTCEEGQCTGYTECEIGLGTRGNIFLEDCADLCSELGAIESDDIRWPRDGLGEITGWDACEVVMYIAREYTPENYPYATIRSCHCYFGV